MTKKERMTIMHAVAILRESAKQHRACGDGRGHGNACDAAKDDLLAIIHNDEIGLVNSTGWERPSDAMENRSRLSDQAAQEGY